MKLPFELLKPYTRFQYGEVIIKVYRCNTADDYNILSHCNLVYERED